MKNKPFMIHQQEEVVKEWEFIDGETVVIHTDKNKHRFSFSIADERLAEFLPIEQELAEIESNLPQLACNTQTLRELKDIMMENIRKVQEDKAYIPQAQEVSKSVGTIVDLAKTEIEYIKAIRSL